MTAAVRDFTVIDVPQGTPEWLLARAGRVTASRADCVLAKGRGSAESVSKRDYRLQLCCERLTGRPLEDGYVNDDMRRGTLLEPEAFAAYESRTGEILHRTGFLAHCELPIGCSLDAHIGDFDLVVEFKAPRSANHLRWLRDGVVPAEYKPQLTHQLLVSGASAADFVSYDPRFPEDLQLFVVRVSRDALDLAAYELALRLFLSEVTAEVAAIEALRAAKAAA